MRIFYTPSSIIVPCVSHPSQSCQFVVALFHSHHLTWLQSGERVVSTFLVIPRNMKKVIASWDHASHDRLNCITTLSCILVPHYSFNVRCSWLKYNWIIFIGYACGCGSSGNMDISNRSNGNWAQRNLLSRTTYAASTNMNISTFL